MNFIRSQLTPLPYPTHSFAGQTIIVTGANTGLGLEAARHFVALNATKVILGCRSLSRGTDAIKDIENTSNRTGLCEVWELDLANFGSVKSFCKKAEGLDRLDVVVENAGVLRSEFTWAEGMETTITVNVVGTFLMALRLLPVLRRSAKKTGSETYLSIVSSEVHGLSKMAERYEPSIFEALKKNGAAYIADRYNTSKLLEIFVVRSLAAQMSSGPHFNQFVILNTLNPGFCHSELNRDVAGVRRLIFRVFEAVLARTTEMGSRTLVAAAYAGKESHGCYMMNCTIKEPSDFVRSQDGKKTQERAFKELMEILEGIQPGITKNI